MSHTLPLIALVALLISATASAQSSYANPVDGKTYTTPGEFRTYKPETPRDQSRQRVKNEGVTLLTSEPDLRAHTSVEDLAAFIQQAETRAAGALTKFAGATVVMLQFNCQPKLCGIQIASDGKAPKPVLQALYDSLTSMPPLRTSGEVIFQVRLKVDA